MNKLARLFAFVYASLLLFSSCSSPDSNPENTTDTNHTSGSEISQQTCEDPYVFPEHGVLQLLSDGEAPYAPDGRNPSLAGDKLLVFFDCAYRKAGLSLSNSTEITYKVVKSDGTVSEGTSLLDTTVSEIRTDYGYVGVCLDVGTTFEKYEKATFDLRFKDAAGKEYTVENKTIYKGLSYLGLDASVFDTYFGDSVTTTVGKNIITQTGSRGGKDFTFTLSLSKWDGNTTAEQIVTISRLFWECYPRMYARFGEAGQSPTEVILDIENEGYGIASASGNRVHLHDQWLNKNRSDYDCLTHEFAHVIQNGWDGNCCEYSGYIERFADACRYLYAFQDGKYNDRGWEMQTVSTENTRETSVRFLVWLDYTYSTDGNDLLLKFFTACRSQRYSSDNWESAWDEILRGSALEGKNIETVWKLYCETDFAKLSTKGSGGSSPLLKQYDVRTKAKG